MEKNTAWEMRLLHCFQTSGSQRRLSWQNGLETRLTRESGMQTMAGPIDSYSVISGLAGHFYWRTNIELQWDWYELSNRAGKNGLSQPSISNPGLSWPMQEGLQSSPPVWRNGRRRMGLELCLFKCISERWQKMRWCVLGHHKMRNCSGMWPSSQSNFANSGLGLVGMQMVTEWLCTLRIPGWGMQHSLGSHWLLCGLQSISKLQENNWIRQFSMAVSFDSNLSISV